MINPSKQHDALLAEAFIRPNGGSTIFNPQYEFVTPSGDVIPVTPASLLSQTNTPIFTWLGWAAYVLGSTGVKDTSSFDCHLLSSYYH